MKVLTFDAEIRNKIPDKNEPPEPEYEYCEGWGDHANMGISFLGCHKSWDDRLEFFDEDNIQDFPLLIKDADLVVGYNIFGFDTALVKATLERKGHPVETGMKGKCYDIFYDIKKSLGDNFPKGWTLDNVANYTIDMEKRGEGARAPELWQDGKIAELINYLAQDVRVEATLFQFAMENGFVRNGAVGVDQLDLQGIQKYQAVA